MAFPSSPLPLISLSLTVMLALSLVFPGWSIQFVQAEAQKTWCVAKPSSDDATLMENINYACSMVDCTVIKKGGPCFYPDNLISHASFAMNLYYQSRGKNHWNCFFNNSGLVTVTDPSFDSCVYAFLEKNWSGHH